MDQIAEFAKRMNYAMKKREVDIPELCRRTGINNKTLYGYSDGHQAPSMMKLVKIGKALNVSLDWLCGMRVKEGGDANER